MFLHRVKMNWKKHQTLTLTILLVALARIVPKNVFGDGLFSDYATLKCEALYLRRCIAQVLPRLLEQNGGSVNGTDSKDRLPGYFTIRTRLS